MKFNEFIVLLCLVYLLEKDPTAQHIVSRVLYSFNFCCYKWIWYLKCLFMFDASICFPLRDQVTCYLIYHETITRMTNLTIACTNSGWKKKTVFLERQTCLVLKKILKLSCCLLSFCMLLYHHDSVPDTGLHDQDDLLKVYISKARACPWLLLRMFMYSPPPTCCLLSSLTLSEISDRNAKSQGYFWNISRCIRVFR